MKLVTNRSVGKRCAKGDECLVREKNSKELRFWLVMMNSQCCRCIDSCRNMGVYPARRSASKKKKEIFKPQRPRRARSFRRVCLAHRSLDGAQSAPCTSCTAIKKAHHHKATAQQSRNRKQLTAKSLARLRLTIQARKILG